MCRVAMYAKVGFVRDMEIGREYLCIVAVTFASAFSLRFVFMPFALDIGEPVGQDCQ